MLRGQRSHRSLLLWKEHDQREPRLNKFTAHWDQKADTRFFSAQFQTKKKKSLVWKKRKRSCRNISEETKRIVRLRWRWRWLHFTRAWSPYENNPNLCKVRLSGRSAGPSRCPRVCQDGARPPFSFPPLWSSAVNEHQFQHLLEYLLQRRSREPQRGAALSFGSLVVIAVHLCKQPLQNNVLCLHTYISVIPVGNTLNAGRFSSPVEIIV